MRKRQSSDSGPDFADLTATCQHLRTHYKHAVSVVMEPRNGYDNLWTVRLIAIYTPTTPQEHLIAATVRPPGVVWECQWSSSHNHNLSSTLFRGLFELEIELSEQIEQLGLPL